MTDTMTATTQHRDRIEQRLLDLLLQGLGLFLVGRDLVEQGLQSARLLTGLDQIDEQVIEVQREFRQRFMQRAAALDVGLDVEHQLLHGRLFMPVADDLECLNHGDAGRHHGRELAAEYRDILHRDFAAASGIALLCVLTRVAATPWRRRSARSAASFAASDLPRTLLPRLSLPSQRNWVSFLVAVADIAINRSLR